MSVSNINFEAQNVPVPKLDYDFIRRWIEAVVNEHDRVTGTVNYLFCDDEHILEVNREFLRHDYYTDIITFDNSRRRLINGDIVLSLDTVRSNAALVGQPYGRELLRVIIHGILHLCGINDKGPGERQIMEQHEDAALAIYDTIKAN